MMRNLLDFFTNNYQMRIREYCQNNSERFEECLDKYHKAFRKEWRNNKAYFVKTDKESNIFDKVDDDDIDEYFYKVKKIYVKWLSLDVNSAYKLMSDLVDDIGLINKKILCKGKVFFRARKTKEVLSRHDILHIPYNKRNLISNQRFSLTGQPIVYLGASLIGVIEELLNSVENDIPLSVSTFEINGELNIIDFRNKLNKIALKIESTDNDLISFGNDKESKLNYKKEIGMMILEGCCSFKVNQETVRGTFYEEYVLPQLLAQVIKHKGMDGIAYSSTKYAFINANVSRESLFFPNDNLALFTRYNYDKDNLADYDELLYEKLKISVPIYWDDISEQYTLEDIDLLCNRLQLERRGVISITNEEQRNMFKDIEIGKCEYWNTVIGKKQLNLLYNALYTDIIKEV